MDIIEAVYNSIKRKKSADAEAERLGISKAEYHRIKDEIIKVINSESDKIDGYVILKVKQNLKVPILATKDTESFFNDKISEQSSPKITDVEENVEKGEKKIVCLTATEPRSPEEIIELMKIDTTKWTLSRYWNKEKFNRWEVSALLTKLPDENVTNSMFFELLQEYSIPPIKKEDVDLVASHAVNESVCAVISLQDLHFGKSGNESIGEVMLNSLNYLLTKGYNNYHLEKLIIVIGPDTLNMDTFNGTTTSGTPVSNSERATEAYMKAFDALCIGIRQAKSFCDKLDIVFISGNHDRLSSFHLVHALSQAFREWEDIKFDTDYDDRKVFTYGANMICFEHGDIKAKNNPLIFAIEHPKEWGETKYRYLYTGHTHHRKTEKVITENEQNGFITRTIPALTSSDDWHYHEKFVGSTRAAVIHIHDKSKGLIGEFTSPV